MKIKWMLFTMTTLLCAIDCAGLADTLVEIPIAASEQTQNSSRRCGKGFIGKGFIMTASKTEAGWLFVLYPNRNVVQAKDESITALGVAGAKQLLNTLEECQEVVWMPKAEAPSGAILKEIAEHCKRIGVLFQ